jgi:hypothetical protein
MKVKNYLLLTTLLFSVVVLTACVRDRLGYATEAKAIVNDLYLNAGTEELYLQHFPMILSILNINFESTSGETNPGGPTLSLDQIYFIIDTLFNESQLSSIEGKTYYSLDDLAAYIDNNTAFQIEREAGSGKITADDLKAVMDYYIALYENNRSVEREAPSVKTTLMSEPMSIRILLISCSCSFSCSTHSTCRRGWLLTALR